MINAIRQQAIVGKSGQVEVLFSDLPMGARVEIIALIDALPPVEIKQYAITDNKPSTEWPPDFFEKTAGCLADDPIERAPQGEYEIREVLK
ncbi:conserved hypothetical protein [Beggiatoa sp. PS]|nr:conserved hypothetical protein [Beggiatoa sp. PS]